MTLASRCFGIALKAVAPGFLLLVALGVSASAQTGTDTQKPAPDEVVFIPPAIGAPADRVGAATREIRQNDGVLSVLVPAGGGMTTLSKPPLVWHLADNFTGRMTAQLAPVEAPQDGVEITGETRFRKGFYALDLSRSAILMEPGKIYVWTVFLAEAGSGKVVAAATTYVERAAGPELTGEDVRSLAANGLWFDALNPFVEIELSGKVRVDQSAGFEGLTRSIGLVLP